MPLYSITRFKNRGMTTVNEPSFATNDWRAVLAKHRNPSHDPQRIDALAPGQSSVVPLQQDEDNFRLILDGYRIKRLPDFKQGAVLFDEMAKEYVKVSNGICILDHTSTEGFAASHQGGQCQFAPHEALALRPLIDDAGKVQVAWTYRSVNACDLSVPSHPGAAERQFEIALDASPRRKKKSDLPAFIGRV
jgi:hypothetical protein